MEQKLPDFSGKVVVFYLDGTKGLQWWAASGIVLEAPKFQRYGERWYLVGQTTGEAGGTGAGDWSANRTAGLAWDAVVHYVVMPPEEYQATMQLPDPREKSRKLWTTLAIGLTLVIFLVLLLALAVWIMTMLRGAPTGAG
jgi:hypothetical protein